MPWPPDLRTALGLAHNPLVRCGCGREVNADMMRDVRPVAALLGTGDAYQCDSCLEGHYRHGRLAHEHFCRAHGAPAAIVALMRERDVALGGKGQ